MYVLPAFVCKHHNMQLTDIRLITADLNRNCQWECIYCSFQLINVLQMGIDSHLFDGIYHRVCNIHITSGDDNLYANMMAYTIVTIHRGRIMYACNNAHIYRFV